MRDKRTNSVNNSPKVDVEYPLPILNGQFVRRETWRARNASIVADQMGAVEAINGECKQIFDL